MFLIFLNIKNTKKYDIRRVCIPKKNFIKNEFISFYNDKSKYYLTEIDKLIQTQEKFYYNEIIKYIFANYIEIDFEPKPNPKNYGYDYNKEELFQ